jgi:hypothetical protein
MRDDDVSLDLRKTRYYTLIIGASCGMVDVEAHPERHLGIPSKETTKEKVSWNDH